MSGCSGLVPYKFWYYPLLMSRKSPSLSSLRELLITVGLIILAAWLGVLIPFLFGDRDGRLESEDVPAAMLVDD